MSQNRQYPRYSCSIEVDILSTSLAYAFSSVAFDISEGGMFLVVPVSSISGLEEDGIALKSGETIQIVLPDYDLTSIYFFTCKIKHSTLVENEELMIGLQFSEVEPREKVFISDLISKYR